MHPLPMHETARTPQLTQRLDRPGRDGLSGILRFPTHFGKKGAYNALGLGIVAANEHRGRPTLQLWIDHQRIANRRKRFDEARFWDGKLETFQQRVGAGEVRNPAINRGARDRIVGVDHHFSRKLSGNTATNLLGSVSGDGNNDHVAGGSRGNRPKLDAGGLFRLPKQQFRRIAGAKHDRVAVLGKAARQRLPDRARANHADRRCHVAE